MSVNKIPSNVTLFEITITQTRTAILLLGASEDEIVLTSILQLGKVLKANPRIALNVFYKCGIISRLMLLTKRQISLCRLALKLLEQMEKHPTFTTYFEKNIKLIDVLIQIIHNESDDIVLEYSTHFLSYLGLSLQIAKSYADDKFIHCLFDHILLSQDPDIKKNCLEIILRCATYNRDFLSESSELNLKVLRCLLKRSYVLYRPVVLDILYTMSISRSITLHKNIQERKEPVWEEMQDKTLLILSNYFKYIKGQIFNPESKPFTDYVNFASTASVYHTIACITIISELAKNDKTRQSLYNIGFQDQIFKYFAVKSDLIRMKLCDIICDFCKNTYVAEHMASDNILTELGKMIGRSHLPWIPDRQMAIKPLYLFLNIKPKLCLSFYRNDILKHICDSLEAGSVMGKAYFIMAVEIYEILLKNKFLTEKLTNHTMFAIVLNLLNQQTETLIRKGIDILQHFLLDEECRRWFIEDNGVQIIIKLFKKSNNLVKTDLVTFVQTAIEYTDLAFAFLKAGICVTLQNMLYQNTVKNLCSAQIIESLYGLELSVKFFEKNALNIDDRIKNGFIFYVGSKPNSFPFKTITSKKKLESSSAMVVVNLQPPRYEYRPISEDQPMPENDIPNIFDFRNSTGNIIGPFKCDIPKWEGEYDFYIREYYKKLTTELDNFRKQDLTIAERVLIIATYIDENVYGFKNILKPTKEHYWLHITELKKKLLTNYIPLGYIRIASIIERAVLFKIFCDRSKIPCTLCRNDIYWAYNEIPILENEKRTKVLKLKYYVVDLIENIGTLLPACSYEGRDYRLGEIEEKWIEPKSVISDLIYPEAEGENAKFVYNIE